MQERINAMTNAIRNKCKNKKQTKKINKDRERANNESVQQNILKGKKETIIK